MVPSQVKLTRVAESRAFLRDLVQWGAALKVVKRAVSHHGSDCSDDCDGTGYCRALTLHRVLVTERDKAPYEIAILSGDRAEGPRLIVESPIGSAPYYYGGGFWNRVEV